MASIENGYHALAAGKLASVVTYVEMTARPDWIDNAYLGEFTVFPPGNLAAYRALFTRIGREWLWSSRLRMSDDALIERLSRPGYRVLLFNGGRGFVELDALGTPNVEISLFGLESPERGRGLGRSMMAHALRTAWNQDTRRVWLHTCTLDDPRALGFYCLMGFRPYARGIEITDDPRVQGYLPEDAAPHVPLLR